MNPASLLNEGAALMGLQLTQEMKSQFVIYLELLQFWNTRINLTSLSTDRDIIIQHFLDSLSCYQYICDGNKSIIDIGTGGGFPSLPLLIYDHSLEMTLVDSSKKKCNFLKEVRRELSLSYRVFHERIESLAHREGERDSYDIVLARALAPLNLLLELGISFAKIQGSLIAFKSKSGQEEIIFARKAMEVLKIRLLAEKRVHIPFLNKVRNLFLFEKIGVTPEEFPRSPKKRERTPL